MDRITSDIYQINEYLESLKRKHIPAEDSNSLILGTFGYLGDVFSNQIQDNIILSSQWLDEMFPIRAKLEKSLLTHALSVNIKDLNAIPAKLDLLIGIKETELLKNMINDKFVISRDIPIYIEEYPFHIENNINVFRQSSSNNTNVYLAQYDFEDNNVLSTTNNPYLLPPVRTRVGNDSFIFIRAKLRQVSMTTYNKKVISTNPIENKTFEFGFENQLAGFELNVTQGNGNVLKFIPIYENVPILDDTKSYVYFSYINSNTVRVKFIKSIYVPKINDIIDVKIMNTLGERGNFSYNDSIIIDPKSETHTYTDIMFLGKPVTNSDFGMNKKSLEDLKKIIPMEALARGSITCNKDLDNYFNMINDRFSRIKFEKKLDNQFERKYYSFMLLKDESDNVIPTNTIDMVLQESELININNRLILKPGLPLEYDKATKKCRLINPNILTNTVIKDKETKGFLYTSPFTTVINKSPLCVSNYLTIFNRRYSLIFKQISDIPLIQLISTNVSWKRDLVVDGDYYKMDIELTQNIDEEYNLITLDANNNVVSSKVKVLGLLYDSDDNVYRYIEGVPLYYDKATKTYLFRFNFRTTNNISQNSTIEIDNLYNIGTSDITSGYLKANGCKMDLYVLVDTGIAGSNRGPLDTLVPGLSSYTLSNIYEIEEGLDFYINFSNIVSSIVTPLMNTDQATYRYEVDSVPVIKYSHLTSSKQVKYLVNHIMDKKTFIDSAMDVLENSFEIDFKFFNTYGESRVCNIGNTSELLDRVNIKLTLMIKFISVNNNDSYIELIKKEIKNYVDNIDNVSNFHMSDIINILKIKFDFISYIEFAKINEYDTIHQSILTDITKVNKHVPEFINIASKEIEYVPDIDIHIL